MKWGISKRARRFSGVTHKPGTDGLFGANALCGADPSVNPDGVLRMHDTDYDCAVCIEMAPEEPPAGRHPCEGVAYENHTQTMAAAIEAGRSSWQEFNCHLGHAHWRPTRRGDV